MTRHEHETHITEEGFSLPTSIGRRAFRASVGRCCVGRKSVQRSAQHPWPTPGLAAARRSLRDVPVLAKQGTHHRDQPTTPLCEAALVSFTLCAKEYIYSQLRWMAFVGMVEERRREEAEERERN